MQHMAWRRGYLAGVSVGVTTPHFGPVAQLDRAPDY